MSVDKLVDSTQLDADLTSVANAIRTKGGTSAQLAFPADFVSAIAAIPSGGTDLLADLCNGTMTRLDDDNITNFLISLRGSSFNLTSIFLKNLTELSGGYCFGNNKVQSIVLPSLEIVTSSGFFFNGASSLTKIDIGSSFSTDSSGIRNNTFNSASSLNLLVLRKTSEIVPLQNINAFNNTPFASGGAGGTLYVHGSLVSSYQSATNWDTILGYTNNQIKSIESTHTDPTAPIDLTLYYADGTPI